MRVSPRGERGMPEMLSSGRGMLLRMSVTPSPGHGMLLRMSVMMAMAAGIRLTQSKLPV